jgi:uncharacterized protein YmfQ (DUF2313 family)
MGILNVKTDDEHAEITANYWPNGLIWRAKRIVESIMYRRLKAMSLECGRFEQIINQWIDGRDITKSYDEVPAWEKFVGMPDKYLLGKGTAEERRRQAQGKLSTEGVKTRAQLKWLLGIFGFAVEVYPGHIFWPNGTDDRVSFGSEKESRFTIVFEIDYENSVQEFLPNFFPVPFPWVFGSSSYNYTTNFIINKVIPANCNALFIRKPAEEGDWDDTIDGPIIEDSTTGAIVEDTA